MVCGGDVVSSDARRLATVRQVWPTVLDALKGRNRAAWDVFAGYRPVAVTGDVVTVAGDSGGADRDDLAAMIAPTVADLVETITGAPADVRILARTGVSADAAKTVQKPAETTPPEEVLAVLAVSAGGGKLGLEVSPPPIEGRGQGGATKPAGPFHAAISAETTQEGGGGYLYRVQRLDREGRLKAARIFTRRTAAERQAARWLDWESTSAAPITRSHRRIRWEGVDQ